MKSYQFPVVITQDEDGMFFAQVPFLPGCHTQAKTLSTLYKRMSEAIELCLEVQKSKQEKIPQNSFVGIQQIEVSV